jgi:hypothetical protein
MKALKFLLPIAAIGGVLYFTRREAKAASPSQVDSVVDATEQMPVVVPSSPVQVPAPIVAEGSGSADSVHVGPGSVVVTVPDVVDDEPQELPTGEVELPSGQVVPVPSIQVETPEIDLQNPDFGGSLQIPVAFPPLNQTPNLPPDSVALLGRLLAEEAFPGWKKVDGQLKPWQAARGLVSDGKFGPKSSLRLASELGMTALVRWWPMGSPKATALEAYRQALLALGASNPLWIDDLSVAAARESGQSWQVSNPAPVSPISWEAN